MGSDTMVDSLQEEKRRAQTTILYMRHLTIIKVHKNGSAYRANPFCTYTSKDVVMTKIMVVFYVLVFGVEERGAKTRVLVVLIRNLFSAQNIFNL